MRPHERVFFVVVLACTLLLLSLSMLRHEKAATRSFRDGFHVASVIRRTEFNGTLTSEPQAHHTTVITTEDGDEITIKRAATSKKKITTISTHENGKITIENAPHPEDDQEDEGGNEGKEVEGQREEPRHVVVVNVEKESERKMTTESEDAGDGDAAAPRPPMENGDDHTGQHKVTVEHESRSLTRVKLSLPQETTSVQ